MYGTVFLGSQFDGINLLREERFFAPIEAAKTLKCVSFEKGQNRVFPQSMLSDIVAEIRQTDHFIFLIGPDEGTTLEKLHEEDDVVLNPFEDYRDVQFTHFEAKFAKIRLDEIFSQETCEKAVFLKKRILLFDLSIKGRAAPEGVKTILRYFRDWGIDSHTLYVNKYKKQWSLQKSSVTPYEVLLRNFLQNIELDKVSRINSFLRDNQIDPNEHIQLLGWTGLENWDRYRSYLQTQAMRSDNFSFLTTNRSIISLPSDVSYYPRVGHKPLGFDFVLADAEIIPHYRRTDAISAFPRHIATDIARRLIPSGRKASDCFAPVVESLMNSILERCTEEGHEMPICFAPLMYGFNEVLLRAKDSGQDCEPIQVASYADLDIALLVRGGRRIGLWSWWVSTMPIILFSRLRYLVRTAELDELCSSENETSVTRWKNLQDVKTFSDYLNTDSERNRGKQVERLIAVLVDSLVSDLTKLMDMPMGTARGSVEIFNTFADQSRNGRGDVAVDIMIGSSSAILPPLLSAGRKYIWKTVIPEEGVFVWMNCICSYANTVTGPPHEELMKHWLGPEFQRGLVDLDAFDPKGYVGLPVIDSVSKVYRKQLDYPLGMAPILDTLRKSEAGEIQYALRPFPVSLWPFLEYQWSQLLFAINQLRRSVQEQAA